MKAWVSIFLLSLNVKAQTLYVASDVDLKSIPPQYRESLWAQQQLQKAEHRGVRDEVMNYSQMFLQNQMSANEFEKALWSWSQSGWSQEERWVLVDTLKKSNSKIENRANWICRLNPDENCASETILSHKLPAGLRHYEGLILDGKAIPSVNWDNMKISNSFYNWTFVSSKYKPIHFRGSWKELQKQNVNLEPLVLGSCDHPQAHSEIQNISNQLYYSEKCIRPSLRPAVEEKSFYEKNKKSIWWGVGLVVGAGVLSTLKGKSIVIDKPGIM